MKTPAAILTCVGCVALLATPAGQAVFKTGVDVVNVTITVSDDDGHFIRNLRQEDFVVYDDGKPQEILSFSFDRVPVSLGMLLDVSGSMTEDKMAPARAAMSRFAYDLLRPDDELFLAEFSGKGRLLQTWTQDRGTFERALDRTNKGNLRSGTALFDTVSAALPLAANGQWPKKALLVLSDGKDTSSRIPVKVVQESIRRSEVIVYALAVDDAGGSGLFGSAVFGGGSGVDAGALRKLTDDTGGRTEVVKGFRNLDRATERLASELDQQYMISYAAPAARDGRWHSIRVEVKKRGAKVRARAGYTAS